jgi:hypothetical protein
MFPPSTVAGWNKARNNSVITACFDGGMRNWLAAAGVILLLAYLMLPMPKTKAPEESLPRFDDVSEKLGGDLHTTRSYVSSRRYERAASMRGCGFPGLTESAQLVFVSLSYGGQGVSTAALSSEDLETTTAEIAIEAGERPLYIVAVSVQPVIWRVTGAVERVRHLVVSAAREDQERGLPLTGVTGVPRPQVTFLSHAACLPPYPLDSEAEAALAEGVLKTRLGRMPDIVTARRYAARFSVPSGGAAVINPFSVWREMRDRPSALLRLLGLKGDDRIRADLRREVVQSYPAGVTAIDPDSVLSELPVRAYPVLPGFAGIQQLVEQGALQDLSNDEYRILRKIRLPAELRSGALLLAKGVPVPDGKPGRACLISEETGRLVQGFDGRNLFC